MKSRTSENNMIINVDYKLKLDSRRREKHIQVDAQTVYSNVAVQIKIL